MPLTPHIPGLWISEGGAGPGLVHLQTPRAEHEAGCEAVAQKLKEQHNFRLQKGGLWREEPPITGGVAWGGWTIMAASCQQTLCLPALPCFGPSLPPWDKISPRSSFGEHFPRASDMLGPGQEWRTGREGKCGVKGMWGRTPIPLLAKHTWRPAAPFPPTAWDSGQGCPQAAPQPLPGCPWAGVSPPSLSVCHNPSTC